MKTTLEGKGEEGGKKKVRGKRKKGKCMGKENCKKKGEG